MEIMALLKAKTAVYHTELESLPYFGELIAHRLPLGCYIHQLRALSIIHSVLEEQIAGSTNEQIAIIWDDGLRKLPLLMQDLHFFEPRVSSDNSPTLEIALSITEKIRLRSLTQPLSLLGYLYVMEGSTLGNHMHQPDIIKSYHLDGFDGSRYYASYKDKIQAQWQQFTVRMNAVLDDSALHGPIVEAAHETFTGLASLYHALYPIRKSENTFHVARINPEAGNHPIPADKREIDAALSTSNHVWSEYPYYEKRYKNRGKRFSDSDTCWLVTLTALEQIDLQKQVDWLCRVLATRGMPSLMMETTLHYLSLELTTMVPEKKAIYQKLHKASGKLKENRLKHFGEKVFQNLAEEFTQSVPADLRKSYKNTGLLLVSAVIDEKNAVPGALSSLQQWLVDADHFPPVWIAAVEQTVNKTKCAVGG